MIGASAPKVLFGPVTVIRTQNMICMFCDRGAWEKEFQFIEANTSGSWIDVLSFPLLVLFGQLFRLWHVCGNLKFTKVVLSCKKIVHMETLEPLNGVFGLMTWNCWKSRTIYRTVRDLDLYWLNKHGMHWETFFRCGLVQNYRVRCVCRVKVNTEKNSRISGMAVFSARTPFDACALSHHWLCVGRNCVTRNLTRRFSRWWPRWWWQGSREWMQQRCAKLTPRQGVARVALFQKLQSDEYCESPWELSYSVQNTCRYGHPCCSLFASVRVDPHFQWAPSWSAVFFFTFSDAASTVSWTCVCTITTRWRCCCRRRRVTTCLSSHCSHCPQYQATSLLRSHRWLTTTPAFPTTSCKT